MNLNTILQHPETINYSAGSIQGQTIQRESELTIYNNTELEHRMKPTGII